MTSLSKFHPLICCVQGIDSRAHSETAGKDDTIFRITRAKSLIVGEGLVSKMLQAVCSPVAFSWVSLIVISTEFSMKVSVEHMRRIRRKRLNGMAFLVWFG